MVSVVTCDGRNIVGTLKGFDQATNVVLHGSHERIFSPDEGGSKIDLGLYFLRGDNIAVVGELDDELDGELNLAALRGQTLNPVTH